MGCASVTTPRQVCCAPIAKLARQETAACAILENGAKVLLPRFLVSQVGIGDEIAFPIPIQEPARSEVLVHKNLSSNRRTSLYLAPIEFVSQPRLDKRDQSFVSARVSGALGISSVFLPCDTVREYFYAKGVSKKGSDCDTLYKVLRTVPSASPAEIRVSFKLRALELKANGVARPEHAMLERALNILGNPELRAHYDTLLANPETPAVFPYGGVGSLLVAGECSRNGETFFARRILAFVPDQLQRRFHLPLRHCEFYADKALCRDARRKLQFWLDPDLIHATWDPSWNRWKHLLGTKIEVQGAFVRGGNYEKRGRNSKFVDCETGLPSRLSVKLPKDFEQDIKTAQNTYCRFGQYSRALDQIRLCLEHKAIERKDLERMCSELGIPGDFDIAQISWRLDYDPFFYRELSRRARRIYLFRDEYIFDFETGIISEIPQLGHATYIFSRTRNMDQFLDVYIKSTKGDIRRNQENRGERLGFVGRLVHGANPRTWLREIDQHLGEQCGHGS